MLADWGVSIRQACRAIRFDTSTYHYKSRRPEQAGLEMRIKVIAEMRVSYALPGRRLLANAERGYRRVHVLLQREGWIINMKKTRRPSSS